MNYRFEYSSVYIYLQLYFENFNKIVLFLLLYVFVNFLYLFFYFLLYILYCLFNYFNRINYEYIYIYDSSI